MEAFIILSDKSIMFFCVLHFECNTFWWQISWAVVKVLLWFDYDTVTLHVNTFPLQLNVIFYFARVPGTAHSCVASLSCSVDNCKDSVQESWQFAAVVATVAWVPAKFVPWQRIEIFWQWSIWNHNKCYFQSSGRVTHINGMHIGLIEKSQPSTWRKWWGLWRGRGRKAETVTGGVSPHSGPGPPWRQELGRVTRASPWLAPRQCPSPTRPWGCCSPPGASARRTTAWSTLRARSCTKQPPRETRKKFWNIWRRPMWTQWMGGLGPPSTWQRQAGTRPPWPRCWRPGPASMRRTGEVRLRWAAPPRAATSRPWRGCWSAARTRTWRISRARPASTARSGRGPGTSSASCCGAAPTPTSSTTRGSPPSTWPSPWWTPPVWALCSDTVLLWTSGAG